MRKLIAQELMSLDGFFAGLHGEVDWHRVGSEYEAYAQNFLESLDMLLFGRITYQHMASYWPSATGNIARLMNAHTKIVFSNTLQEATWENTRLIQRNAENEISKLKQEAGKDLAILGSADFSSNMLNAGLIDEYHITVAPVVLGKGKPLFKEVQERVTMKQIHTQTLQSGHVQLFYQVKNK
ncbi:dihydrofolate reductase family protein [Virgibacillus salarius]|uniref:dihydrofolate reductase family protein n=1 Tax=Virgibacillus salarius TaxID=447199 RepID=UPI0024901BF1|nr:dihydrofolate reductase family protein [Virgibacillus salarius]WBX79336.1 dihydrofolate reductase family protein [Virgibacillus salarius]